MQKQTDAHKSETEFLKACTDQLQLEADAYRTQTDSVIKTLQAEVSAATRSSIKGAVGEPTKTGKVWQSIQYIGQDATQSESVSDWGGRKKDATQSESVYGWDKRIR